MSKKSIIKSISLDDETDAKLEELKDETGWNYSKIVRFAIMYTEIRPVIKDDLVFTEEGARLLAEAKRKKRNSRLERIRKRWARKT